MKKLILLLTATLAIGAAAQAGTITLSVSSPIDVGQNFDVLVQANNVFTGLDPDDVVLGYGFNVTVGDPAVVQFLGETAGNLFTDITDQLLGTPQVAGLGIVAPGDFSGSLLLATLHFKALIAGATTVGVTSDLSDFNQGLTFFLAPTSDIQAEADIHVVPEPGTIGLALLAIGSIGFLKRKARRN